MRSKVVLVVASSLVRSQVQGARVDLRVCPYWLADLIGPERVEDYFSYDFRWGVREANDSHY